MQRLLPSLDIVEIERLRDRAYLEFADVGDFIWKAPRLIDNERELEERKLDAYFSNDGEHRQHRQRRREMEQRKLDSTFPYMITTGNLFALLSLFESYLLLLADELQTLNPRQLNETRGQGVSRLFSYFKSCGLSSETQPLYEQVMAALKIRNCLIHASGMLSWSKEAAELRRIETTMSFLSIEDRQRRRQFKDAEPLVKVTQSGLGERIVVQGLYCHVLCSYLSQYFMSLCESANASIRVRDA